MLLKLLMAASLAASPTPTAKALPTEFAPPPTLNLSAIRSIECDDGWGTGFLIGKNTLATALHVGGMTNCHDRETSTPLKMYYNDEKHDFALMTGDYPDMPYFRVDCKGFKTGANYYSFGQTPYAGRGVFMFRGALMVAQSDYTGKDFKVQMEDGVKNMPGMRHIVGNMVPGMSGGPITDVLTGSVEGINNVGNTNMLGWPGLDGYSFELKNTVLCKR